MSRLPFSGCSDYAPNRHEEVLAAAREISMETLARRQAEKEGGRMTPLLFAMVASFLAATGARDQLLVARLAGALGRGNGLLVVALVFFCCLC